MGSLQTVLHDLASICFPQLRDLLSQTAQLMSVTALTRPVLLLPVAAAARARAPRRAIEHGGQEGAITLYRKYVGDGGEEGTITLYGKSELCVSTAKRFFLHNSLKRDILT